MKLIVKSQNKEGGWRYLPKPGDADLSVTVTQLMALAAARDAGVDVPKEAIDRAIDYVKKSQNSDGGFRYLLQGGTSGFARSAAAVTALYRAGAGRLRRDSQGIRLRGRSSRPARRSASRRSSISMATIMRPR